MKGRMKLDGAVRRKTKIEVSFSKERGLTFSRQTAKILKPLILAVTYVVIPLRPSK